MPKKHSKLWFLLHSHHVKLQYFEKSFYKPQEHVAKENLAISKSPSPISIITAHPFSKWICCYVKLDGLDLKVSWN